MDEFDRIMDEHLWHELKKIEEIEKQQFEDKQHSIEQELAALSMNDHEQLELFEEIERLQQQEQQQQQDEQQAKEFHLKKKPEHYQRLVFARKKHDDQSNRPFKTIPSKIYRCQ